MNKENDNFFMSIVCLISVHFPVANILHPYESSNIKSLYSFSKLFAKKLEKLFEVDFTNPDCPENASSMFR